MPAINTSEAADNSRYQPSDEDLETQLNPGPAPKPRKPYAPPKLRVLSAGNPYLALKTQPHKIPRNTSYNEAITKVVLAVCCLALSLLIAVIFF